MNTIVSRETRKAVDVIKTAKNKFLKRYVKTNSSAKKPKSFSSQMLHPFTPSQLNSLPEKWEIRGPDFVGIGVPKAGTSWWSVLLREHPKIVEHRLFSEKREQKTKELHYFEHFGYQGLEEHHIQNYRQAFAAPKGSICGEWTPSYLCQPMCIEYLSQSAPSAKILIMLRNPIERTVSHLNHILSNRVQCFDFSSEQRYMFETYSLYPEVFSHSLYANALRQVFRYFDRKQILVLQYEKCRSEPEKEIAKTYNFLGIDDQYLPQSIRRKVNKQQYIVPQVLDKKERHRLYEYFMDDVKATADLLPELDLSFWSDFYQESRSYI